MSALVEIQRGDSPVILSMPHTGTFVPAAILDRLNDNGQTLGDTDWHVDRLYQGLLPAATTVRAVFHRYLIDANRDPSGASLYPGQNTTGLCPLTDFDGHAIYQINAAPDAKEVLHRRKNYHQPYHDALEKEIHRVREKYGVVVLYDCHSIRSAISHLFDGVLPDFNIGTNHGRSCGSEIERWVSGMCQQAEGLTSVLNGRFAGGWTTRHYGCPQQGIHTIQMELAQSCYLNERSPQQYFPQKAEPLRVYLREILQGLESIAYRIAIKN